MRTLAALAWLAGTAVAQTWHPTGPPARATFVAVDPSNADRLYTGTLDGLFLSDDGGTTWTSRTRGLPGGRCLVQAAAFDPAGRRIVVGVGDRLSSTTGCGAFGSVGRARRWRSLGIDGENVSALAFGPGRRDVLWAGTAGDGTDFAGAIAKKVGRGGWQGSLELGDVDDDVTALVVRPGNGAVVWAATNNAGVVKTADGGDHWEPANTGLPRFDFLGNASPSGAFVFAIPLAIDRSDPDTLYVGTLDKSCCPDEVDTGGNVFVTHDGAGSWTASTGLGTVNVLALAVDPSRPATVYAGTTNGAFRSTDGGRTFAAFGLAGRAVESLAITGDGTTLFAAASGDVVRTDL